MSGTSSATSTSNTPISEIEAGIEAEVPVIEADVTTILQHPTGPFAGIVAWAEGEFAKLRSEMGHGKAPAPSSGSSGSPTPPTPPSPPAASLAPASPMSVTMPSLGGTAATGIAGAAATPGGKE